MSHNTCGIRPYICVTRHYSIDTHDPCVFLSHTCDTRDTPWAIIFTRTILEKTQSPSHPSTMWCPKVAQMDPRIRSPLAMPLRQRLRRVVGFGIRSINIVKVDIRPHDGGAQSWADARPYPREFFGWWLHISGLQQMRVRVKRLRSSRAQRK